MLKGSVGNTTDMDASSVPETWSVIEATCEANRLA